MPTHHDETLLERYQREHRVYEGMNMSKAEELANKWCTAITTRAHVDAGNSMADELRRLSAINAELLEALKLADKTMEEIGKEMTVGERYTNAGQYLIDTPSVVRAAIAKAQGEQ